LCLPTDLKINIICENFKLKEKEIQITFENEKLSLYFSHTKGKIQFFKNLPEYLSQFINLHNKKIIIYKLEMTFGEERKNNTMGLINFLNDETASTSSRDKNAKIFSEKLNLNLIREKNDALMEKIQSQNKNLKNLQEENEYLNQRINSMKNEEEMLKKKISNKDEEIKFLSNKIEDTNSKYEYERLKCKIIEKEKESEIEKLKEEIKHLKQQLKCPLKIKGSSSSKSNNRYQNDD
jgi:chromosome segregation ATPase